MVSFPDKWGWSGLNWPSSNLRENESGDRTRTALRVRGQGFDGTRRHSPLAISGRQLGSHSETEPHVSLLKLGFLFVM